MTTETTSSWNRDEFLRAIRQVRRRWRLKVALRGVTLVAGVGLAAFLASAFGLEQLRFSSGAIIAFRVAVYTAAVGLVGWFFVRPLLRRVTDEQVALYVEEHDPELQALLVSAVDAEADLAARRNASPQLVERLVETAVEKCRAIEFGREFERRTYHRAVGGLVALALATAALFVAGPAWLRHAALALLPARGIEAASPYSLDIQPGDTTVSRGSDVAVSARLVGFEASEAELYVRRGANAPFERAPMVHDESEASFEGMIFDVDVETDYFVSAVGVRSPVFTIEAADLPYVERLEMEYRFPAYTGLEPRTIDRGGDIAVLRGTTVVLHAWSTIPTAAGRIIRDDDESIPMTVEADGSLVGSLLVEQNGFYRIELESGQEQFVTASPQYVIDVLTDQPPAVSFVKPGRDTQASPIEEVYLEVRADDDYGVARLDLAYSVNGMPEQRARLYQGGKAEVSAGHTFFLEELELEPGDVVSYYARVDDNNAVSGRQSVSSDMYFVQIRPFRKDYRAAESQGGGGGGGGGGGAGAGATGALSEQQRQIVSATFNVERDKARSSAEEYRENLVFLALSQGGLREQVETLVQQIQMRLGGVDEAMQEISGYLTKAAEEMRAAETSLQARKGEEALPPEQRALQNLQRAEEVYEEVRVSVQQQGGGGGGGGGQSRQAEDLADLFELEMDRLRNQYETAQRGQQQQADNQIDEMLERLRELARRQEQEAERQRRTAGQQSAGSGAASARQRQLADETEETARRLERLSREENRPDLARAARRMQEAADAMRRAAASGDVSAMAEAERALERLQQAGDQLQREQSDRLSRDIEEARERVRQLREDQEGIAEDVNRLSSGLTANRGADIQQLTQRKDAQAGELADIERQLDRTANDFRREQPHAAGKVGEAAEAIRDDRIKEKIRYSKGVMQGRQVDAEAFEQQIGSDLASLEARLDEAAAAVGERRADPVQEALDHARDLVRGMESLGERARQQAEGQEGQQGSESQQAQGGGAQGGGSPADDPRGRSGSEAGRAQNRAGGADRWAGGYGGVIDSRQFQRELGERRGDAQALRNELAELGVDVRDFDAIIREMREFAALPAYADAEEIKRLQSLVDDLKRYEYAVGRQLLGAEATELFLSGAEEVPPEYRQLIEEYYRALSRDSSRH